MNDLFLVFMLLSIIGLIAGLIKPSLFRKIFKEKSNRKTISLVFGISIIVFFILFGSTTNSSQNTQTPSQTPSASPSPTSETTSQSAQTAAEKARLDKETEYLKQASDISNENGQLLGYSGNFLSQKPNPLFWTEDEKIKLATSMGFIKSNYSRGKELQPPTRFEDAHNIFLESLKKYSDAMDLMAQGIDSLDANKMQKATNLMAEGNTLAQQATAKFLELKQ